MNKKLIKKILTEEFFNIMICESIEQTNFIDYIYDTLMLEKLLIGQPVSVPELRKILHNKILNFEFIKLDGNIRPARGTTMMKYIPKKDHPTGNNPSSEKVATFFDLDKNNWRSVSNRSDEIVLKQDIDNGKLKIQVTDKKPKEEPKKEPEISKVPGVSSRPIITKMEPIVKPSIKPDIISPIPKPEDIESQIEEKPLDINDPTIQADNIKDDDIIVSKPNDIKPFKPEPFKPEVFEPEPFKPEVFEPKSFKPEPFKPEPFKPEPFKSKIKPFKNNILSKEDIIFPDDDENEEEI